jgi:hypothetical protein
MEWSTFLFLPWPFNELG